MALANAAARAPTSSGLPATTPVARDAVHAAMWLTVRVAWSVPSGSVHVGTATTGPWSPATWMCTSPRPSMDGG
mgnify:CR=1 FL=1